MRKDDRLERLLGMEENELCEYIADECAVQGITLPFDQDDIYTMEKQDLLNLIADYIDTDLKAELHSECRLEPGNQMFPNAETAEEIEEEMQHLASRD